MTYSLNFERYTLALACSLSLVHGMASAQIDSHNPVTASGQLADNDVLQTGVFVPPGIIGDGKADNTNALQEALNAGRGPIYLPAGKYLLSESLRIPSHSGVQGVGTLYMLADQPVLVCEGGDQELTDINIQGITIEKKWKSQSEAEAIIIQNASNIRLSGLNITGICSVPVIDLVDCRQFSVSDCYIHDCLVDVLTQVRSSGRAVDLLGVSLMRCSFGQVTGNRIENLEATPESLNSIDCQTDGISPMLSNNIAISNNTIRNVGEGIDMRACEACTVSNNAIEDCYHFGIKVIHGSRLNAIGNNSIRNASLAGFTLYFGETRFGPNYGNVVNGNVITNTGGFPEDIKKWKYGWPRAGIEIVNDSKPDNSVHRYLITNNMIVDNQKAPTCKYGVIERFIEWDDEGKPHDLKNPHDDDKLFTNRISNNYVFGISKKDYRTGSEVTP